MQRQPLLIPPTSCFHCELFNNTCDICNTRDGHCMKYHVKMEPSLACCSWRQTAGKGSVVESIALANAQLAQCYSIAYDAKQRNTRLRSSSRKRGHIRGLTRRLTINADFFKPS